MQFNAAIGFRPLPDSVVYAYVQIGLASSSDHLVSPYFTLSPPHRLRCVHKLPRAISCRRRKARDLPASSGDTPILPILRPMSNNTSRGPLAKDGTYVSGNGIDEPPQDNKGIKCAEATQLFCSRTSFSSGKKSNLEQQRSSHSIRSALFRIFRTSTVQRCRHFVFS